MSGKQLSRPKERLYDWKVIPFGICNAPGIFAMHITHLKYVLEDWWSNYFWIWKRVIPSETVWYFLGSWSVPKGFLLIKRRFKQSKSGQPTYVHGFATFYRRFIKNFSSLVFSRYWLWKFIWGSDQLSSFSLIKVRLTDAPVLALPNFDFIFEV